MSLSELDLWPNARVPRRTGARGVAKSSSQSYAGGRSREATIERELDMLERGLCGSHQDLHRLVVYLTPVIQARVGRVLSKQAQSARRNPREEVEDLTQDVFTTLFANDGAVLRAWAPDKGLTLKGFVGLVARRRAGAIVTSRRRNPWWEEPVGEDVAERILGGDNAVERAVVARDALQKALHEVAQTQSDRGRELLRLLFVEGHSTEEVQDLTAMSRGAVYQWRSRLAKALRTALEQGGTHT